MVAYRAFSVVAVYIAGDSLGHGVYWHNIEKHSSTFRTSPVSMMPEDLYRKLKPQELRDLFAYLQSAGPR